MLQILPLLCRPLTAASIRCILFTGSHGVNSDTMQLMERHLNEALHKKHFGNVNAIALFDTGAGMTVISKSLLHRFCAAPEKETLRAGNNNGMVREFQTAAIPGFLTFTITKPKLLVSGLHNINGFPMCGHCSFGFKTRRLLYRMSIFATSYTANRRR